MSLKVIIETIAINTLLVTEAREINRVTSAGERGAYKISTIF